VKIDNINIEEAINTTREMIEKESDLSPSFKA